MPSPIPPRLLSPIQPAGAVVNAKGQRPDALRHHVDGVVPARDRAFNQYQWPARGVFEPFPDGDEAQLVFRVRNTALARGHWRRTTLPATRSMPGSNSGRPCRCSVRHPPAVDARSITWPSGHQPNGEYSSSIHWARLGAENAAGIINVSTRRARLGNLGRIDLHEGMPALAALYSNRQ